MKYRFGDLGDSEARAAKIRTLFHGGTVADHAEHCFDNGLWSETEVRAKALRACREEVREALSAEVDGLPWAGETEKRKDGKPVWRQLDFWTFENFAYNINRRKVQTGADLVTINRLVQLCQDRFGKAPKKVALVEIEDEPDGE